MDRKKEDRWIYRKKIDGYIERGQIDIQKEDRQI